MTGSWSLLSPACLPSPPFLHPKQASPSSLHSNSKWRLLCLLRQKKHAPTTPSAKPQGSQLQKLASMLQYGAILVAVEAPSALAVTGEEDIDIPATATVLAIVGFFYFIVAPPLIMNWMRVRWFKRKFLETYLQFMFTFLFYPAIMLWAPFINFRKFPRDPTMKYPWSKPKEGTPLYKIR